MAHDGSSLATCDRAYIGPIQFLSCWFGDIRPNVGQLMRSFPILSECKLSLYDKALAASRWPCVREAMAKMKIPSAKMNAQI